MRGLKATVWSRYDMFCPTSLVPRTGMWVCLQRVHTIQEMVNFGKHLQAKNFRCGATISPPRESVTTWNHQSELLECQGQCLLVFVSSVLHPGLTCTQKITCRVDGLADHLALREVTRESHSAPQTGAQSHHSSCRASWNISVEAALSDRSKTRLATLLPSPRLPQLFLSIHSPLRQIRCLSELRRKALPLHFLIQQQQCNPSFSHWPRISYEPQTLSESFCPQQQSDLPRANRTIFSLGLGISLTSFLSLIFCFMWFHSSFPWTNYCLLLE